MKTTILAGFAAATLCAVFSAPTEAHANDALLHQFRLAWDEAVQDFEDALVDSETQILLDGQSTSVDTATDYEQGVEVCPVDDDDRRSCEPIVVAHATCTGGGCHCSWTDCNDIAAACSAQGETDVECHIILSREGYPIGLYCSCGDP